MSGLIIGTLRAWERPRVPTSGQARINAQRNQRAAYWHAREMPAPWEFFGTTSDGGVAWIAPIGTQPPTRKATPHA